MPVQLTSTEKDALVRRLNSPDDGERQKAQTELQALIADDVRRIQQCRTLQEYASVSGFLLWLIAFMCEQIIGHSPIWGVVEFIAIIGIILAYKAQYQAKDAVHNLDALDIPQAVGVLLDVFSFGGIIKLADTSAALTRLLPRLKANDTAVFTPRQRQVLYGLLSKDVGSCGYRYYANADLRIAILRALEQIGDGKAIPYVAKLAQTARNAEVRQAAEECLPFLQQRAEQTRIEQTLLRAGTQPASPDTLLRPTNYAAPTEPQQLLRASTTEGDVHAP